MCPMNPRLLRPTASGFDPRRISGVLVWLDAADTSYNASTGTWADKSGNSRNFTEAVAENRPIVSTTTQNGQTILEFDGSNDRLTNNTNFLQISNCTLFATFRRLGNTFGGVISSASDLDGSPAVLIDSSLGRLRGHANLSTAGVGVVDSFCVFSGTVNAGATTLFVNGTQRDTDAAIGSLDTTATTTRIGTYRQANANFFNGYIGEIIAYNRVLTTDERKKVEGYLAWKWGLQSQLPYDHPFAGGFPGFGSQKTPSDPDALTYLAAVAAADGAPVEVGVAVAVDDFFRGIKADNTFSAIKSAALLCGARTLAGALVPLVGAAPTNYNFVDPDYNRETGLKGNGTTKYLDSGRNSNADPQDNFHIAAYATEVTTSASSGTNWFPMYIGTGGGSSGSCAIGRNQGNSTDLFFRNRTSVATLAAGGTATGLLGNSRGSGGEYLVRASGANSTITEASQSPFDGNVGVFRSLIGDTSITYSNGRLAFYSIGESISDLAALDARVTALVTSIGAAL